MKLGRGFENNEKQHEAPSPPHIYNFINHTMSLMYEVLFTSTRGEKFGSGEEYSVWWGRNGDPVNYTHQCTMFTKLNVMSPILAFF